jgi:hypothetical protein
MRQRIISKAPLIVAIIICTAPAVRAYQLQAWGSNSDGQVSSVPAGDTYVAVAAGDAHGLALRSDGTVVAWGRNRYGECSVPAGTYRAIAAGADFSLAIRTDGTLAAWGHNADGQVSRVPVGSDFAAVEGGESFAVALRTNGSIVAWGNDRWGQVSGTPKGTGFVAVVAGDGHAVALRSNGALVAWGYWGAIVGTPTSSDFTALGAGGEFCVALRRDGSLVAWGSDWRGYGVSRAPAGNDYIAVTAGYLHGLALKKDGSLVGWGAGRDSSSHPNWGQANPPTGKNYTAVAAGLYFSLALTGEAVAAEIADDFNDNRQGRLWTLINDNPVNCWLDEINQRLELRATAHTRATSAYYLSEGWQVDTTRDFTLKVDFHVRRDLEATGQVLLGLAPDKGDREGCHVVFGAGCSQFRPYLWLETIDGAQPKTDFAERPQLEGVLYVSYEAALDRLYVSTTGYGARNAWRTVPGLLGASWGSRPLYLYLGGGSDGQTIGSGDAWLDNFAVETGGPARPTLRNVERFWSPVLQQHFYTMDPAERDLLLRSQRRMWTHEGPVFQAADVASDPGLAPVYRFWSVQGAGHFYTLDPTESEALMIKFAHLWTFEGVAFFAYPEGSQPPTSKAVHRFWRPRDNSHFYTIDPAEQDLLLKEYAKVYTYEGVAFYAFE